MKCGNCGYEFEKGIFCPECGTKVEEDRETQNKGVFCLKCREQFAEEIQFCPYCGMAVQRGLLGTTHSSIKTSATMPIGSLVRTVGKAAGVVGILIVVIFVGLIVIGLSVTDKEAASHMAKNEKTANQTTEEVETEDEGKPAKLEQVEETQASEMGEEILEDSIENMDTDNMISYEEWVGSYMREAGPASSLIIWSVDETGILFAAGIGSSGYLAYRDIRDCIAEWTSASTAVYENEDGGRIEISLAEDGIIVSEERTDAADILLLTGVYEKEDNINSHEYGFVLKDSDRRRITENDLEELGPSECRIARNEIYARHGRMFTDEQLQNYFDACIWYSGEIAAADFDLDVLNDIERENAEFISAYEEKMGYK